MGIQYDRSVIQSFANHLYMKARWIIFSEMLKYSFFCSIATYACAYFMTYNFGFSATSHLGFAFFGLVVGSYFGYQNGQFKSFSYRLEAQRALCFVQIELNTSKHSVLKNVA